MALVTTRHVVLFTDPGARIESMRLFVDSATQLLIWILASSAWKIKFDRPEISMNAKH